MDPRVNPNRLIPLIIPRRIPSTRCGAPRTGGSRWLGLIGLSMGLTLLLAACEDSSSGATSPFEPEEQQLIEETLQLMRLRIERARDPQRADEMARELGPLLDEALLEAQLQRLSADPVRGQRLLSAIHDSLKAMRNEIFPPAQGGPGDDNAVPGVGEDPESGPAIARPNS